MILRLREIVSFHEGELPALMLMHLYRLEKECRSLLDQTTLIEDDMQSIVFSDDLGSRLMEMPGVGLIVTAGFCLG
jgi:hypothetical protein